MNRRDFIAGSVAGLALLPSQSSAQNGAGGRRVYPMNRDWLFGRQSTDDAGLTKVTLPHTNMMLPWHSFDDRSYEYVSVYKRHFRVPASAKGQRVFVDFEGAMTASTVTINGHKFPEFKGGYTPFSFELTPHLDWKGENTISVELDSSERPDIPPFGGNIDYLTFGGIYREVSLRAVPQDHIENVFAQPQNVMSMDRTVKVRCYVTGNGTITAELRDGSNVIATATGPGPELTLSNLGDIKLWSLIESKAISRCGEVRKRRILNADRLSRSQVYAQRLHA